MKSIKNEEPLPFDPTLNTDNLTPDEKEVIKEKFLLFDEDGSGSISKEELGAAMRYMGLNPTEAEVQSMLDSLDEDGTCQLEFPEFLKLMSQIKNHDPLSFDLTGQLTTKQIAEIQEKFLQFDDDQDGVIDKSELGAILRYMGQTPTDLELEDILLKLDEDGTNVLEFPEFLKLKKLPIFTMIPNWYAILRRLTLGPNRYESARLTSLKESIRNVSANPANQDKIKCRLHSSD